MSSSLVDSASTNLKSPFCQSSNTKRRHSITSLKTGDSAKHVLVNQPSIELEVDDERTSTIFGASCNLMNALIGAGIVGMPYAMKETGLGAGIIMIFVCAILTEKSLRLLVETAKYVGVSTYELLLEACFGKVGFIFISVNMLILSYGALVAYLLLIKDTLPFLIGIDPSNVPMRRAVLIISSLFICLPLSSQRDVADLAFTSKISVVFDCIMVAIVIGVSPIAENAEESGGYSRVIANSGFFKLPSFFIGLGVLSFAFVCQHASFVIAGSLKNPTKERWEKVTKLAVATCGTLAMCCGVAGYLGFQANTDGNILNSFLSYPNDQIKVAANVARGLLCSAIFFVYPLESFVARHACVALLFKGRHAHGGDDHYVLARKDRRIVVTAAIYLCALIPALFLDNLGSVLSVTGTVAGSSLSYIGPGAAYLAVHGSVFLHLVKSSFLFSDDRRDALDSSHTTITPQIKSQELCQLVASSGNSLKSSQDHVVISSKAMAASSSGNIETFLWFFLLMPLWTQIAKLGEQQLMIYRINEALKKRLPNRLGKVTGSSFGVEELYITQQRNDAAERATRASHKDDVKFYNSTCEMRENNFTTFSSISIDKGDEDEEVEDPQLDPPSIAHFLVAIGYIVFGLVALFAGLFSISFESPGT